MYFDIIIVGGGHAGIEAAYISSKIVKKILIITYNINNIGEMSCNPAIGGIGKSQLVKEIDALGGLMGKLSDLSGIQYKILNTSKGDAVRSTRIQVDKYIYKKNVLNYLKKKKNIYIYQDEVIDLIINNNTVYGVYTLNKKFFSNIVILTTGTFLNSKIFIGDKCKNGGRLYDHSSKLLSNCLLNYPFNYGYFKTGTPPRICKNSILFKKLEVQYSDNISYFSIFGSLRKYKKLPQLKCYITYTNNLTHEIILKNINKSSLYKGLIKGIGPRYCPSIEDKVINFPNKKKHRIFLEPESLLCNLIYPNGISTSFPLSIQKKIIKSIYGLEKAKIIYPGYAVEYLYFDPIYLYKTLESKIIKNLFFAGQINGTTGYEEAASQGIIAGINASLKIKKENFKFIPNRLNSYIGILIDDLCNKGVNEPYRIFTSRSEYRLHLREDNADYRLTSLAYKLKLINKKKWFFFKNKMKLIKKNYNFLKNKFIYIKKLPKKIINKYFINKKNKKINVKFLVSNSIISIKKLFYIFNKNKLDNKFLKEVEILLKYRGYIKKQKLEIKKINFYKNIFIPKNINYKLINGLSNEIIHKLEKYKPKCLDDAYNISGVTPVSILIILIYIKKNIQK